MKKMIVRILLVFVFIGCSHMLLANDPEVINTHRVMSCNIRVALPEDSIKGVGWDNRKTICVEVMKRYNPDIICTQEVIGVQYEYLTEALSGYYSFGFVGPEMDAFPVGYHGIAKNVIFFSKKRYKFVSAGAYWLSETPEIGGSKSWDTARARHCNWVRLIDTYSGKEFRVMNLHLDHMVQEAKEKQIQMVLNEANQYSKDFPQLLVGDYNADISNNVIKKIHSSGWLDTYTQIHGEGEAGASVHEFKGVNDEKAKIRKRIDFIFSKGPVKSLASGLIKDNIDGIYPSDHFFLFADIEFN